MEISELKDLSELEEFKSKVWPVADIEHYGDNQPNFYRKEMTFIAKDGERILGYIGLVIDSGVAQIEPLMVENKGQGTGTIILKHAEKILSEIGVHKVWLETGADWKSKNFYEKNGYIVRTVLPNHVGHRDSVLMDKML